MADRSAARRLLISMAAESPQDKRELGRWLLAVIEQLKVFNGPEMLANARGMLYRETEVKRSFLSHLNRLLPLDFVAEFEQDFQSERAETFRGLIRIMRVCEERLRGKPPSSSTPPEPAKTQVKEPSETDFQVYRLAQAGLTLKQIAERFADKGLKMNQGNVLRRLKRVKEWIEAGNELPSIESPSPLEEKPSSMDQ